MMSPVLASLILIPSLGHAPLEKSPAEEHSEYVVRIELIFMELLGVPLSEVILCSMLIVKLPFLGVV